VRIVIDLQAAQTPDSRHRGIGRYSIALAKAMLRNRGEHEVLIALNGMFADTIVPLRETFSGLIPADQIHVWHATVPPVMLSGAPQAHRHAAELVREAFLASLDADVVHVASMFESGSYSVTSLHKPAYSARTAVTLYDLIPHIYPDLYLDTPGAQRNYGEKLRHLCDADLWLAISESSRQEGIQRLGLAEEQVVNISSAADEHFTPAVVAEEREQELRQRYGLPRPFVMYTGGIDHRKNIEGLIGAWAGLPAALRDAHQLSIVCSVLPKDRTRLEQLALEVGLSSGDMVLTGFVPESDLVDLYRLCKLFVFPSQHEGFGLPALEAMSCGAPVIGSDNSSIPEVIGRADALFDARSTDSITAKMRECLEDEQLRTSLADHARVQAKLFNWDACARAALSAFERAVAPERPAPAAAVARPKLAFVSPMPPERSGIAGYSAGLLPALAAHYQIDLILDQATLDAPGVAGLCGVQTAEWFLEHGGEYDRVLYQFGNSTYHQYMLPLLERFPGTVVLHDFYLSGLMAHLELHGGGLQWSSALYESHGWAALSERFHASPLSDAIYAYPANFPVLREAQGVIVHSEHALRLARQWYGREFTDDWALIPLLRTPATAPARAAARERLGLPADDFIVCSFGMLGPTKLNQRLLRAWRECDLARAPGSRLLFVGEQQRGAYGAAFDKELGPRPGNVQVIGWVDQQGYRDYLDAADVAVQLRTLSRGETSAAVLDCMNHGLPTIANREGSMADLDPDAVWLLPQEFTDRELAVAIDSLWREPQRRAALAQRAREVVHTLHHPEACAAAYAQALEGFALRAQTGVGRLVDEIGKALAGDAAEPLLTCLAQAIALNLPDKRPAHQRLVDITHLVQAAGGATALPAALRRMIEDRVRGWRVEPVYQAAAGEWRYARQYMLRQLGCPDHVLRDDPVELQPGDLWCAWPTEQNSSAPPLQPPQRAIELALAPPGLDNTAMVSAALAATAGGTRQRRWFVDISELVQRDWQSGIQRVVKNYLLELLLHPPEDTRVVPVCATVGEIGYRVAERFTLQLAGIESGRARGHRIKPRPGDLFFGLDLQPHVIAAQADFLEGLQEKGVQLAFMVYDLLPIRLPECFSPGAAEHHARWLAVVAKADMAVCISRAVADDLALWLRQNPAATGNRTGPQIRAVHLGADLTHSLPTLGVPEAADGLLDQLRQRPSFLMVGTLEPRKDHATVLAAFERLWSRGLDVALVISGRPGWMVESLENSMRSHPQRGERLFWIRDSSDEYLERVYGACACLIAASRGEGFGLPLVEAAQHGLPIIARDLPVFRELAGEHAFYFQEDAPEALADALEEWLALYREGRHPSSKGMPWQTWHESAERLKQLLLAPLEQPPATAGGGRQGARSNTAVTEAVP
jgi:glycosyltransferase involved in cell wall biosynthesis